MANKHSKEIFELFNRVSDVKPCPQDRNEVCTLLDSYAQAAVNLYGVISRKEFLKIFNTQNQETITPIEMYNLLLPKVVDTKEPKYTFYKYFIVNRDMIANFDLADLVASQQKDKPRYIPNKEDFLKYMSYDYNDNNKWDKLLNKMKILLKDTNEALRLFKKMKKLILHERNPMSAMKLLFEKDFAFPSMEAANEFISLFSDAANNNRIWFNNGYTPIELFEIRKNERSDEPELFLGGQGGKIRPTEPCPCGSGKKYKLCCAQFANSLEGKLSDEECLFFYETWHKVLNFANSKLKISNYKIDHNFDFHQHQNLLLEIRDLLWENSQYISDFIASHHNLSFQEIILLKSWATKFIKGSFVIMKNERKGSIFMSMDTKGCYLYCVKGISDTIFNTLRYEIPTVVNTVLIPFKGKIIYDSFIGCRPVRFGQGMTKQFILTFKKAKEEHGIITTL